MMARKESRGADKSESHYERSLRSVLAGLWFTFFVLKVMKFVDERNRIYNCV